MHKFEWENPYFDQEPRKIVIEVGQDASLTEMLEAFQSYLKAVGYGFDGNIDVVPEHSFDDTYRDSEFEINEEAVQRRKLWDATPEEWNEAYKNVTMKHNGKPIE